jgi:hypothetical protein|tara:strand:- start:535 stop:639 length:105 start_codon:yes stop_codon:yes gene_type:complete
MEGGRDCVKDRFSWPNGKSMKENMRIGIPLLPAD